MSDEQLNQVYSLLDTLKDQIESSSRITEKDGTLKAIENVRTDIKTKLVNKTDKKEDIANLIDCLTAITDNISNFTSDDPIKITQGVLSIIGSVGGVVGGPYGPIIAAGCGLISSILSLFGGGGTSLADQLQAIIEQALEDFKDEQLQDDVNAAIINMRTITSELMGIARYNGGILKDKETGFLTEAQFQLVGNEILAELQTQLDKYKCDNDDDSKCRRVATYTYYYSNICLLKYVLLTIHCGLLRRNEMEGIFSGVSNYLYEELPAQGKKNLFFMSRLPDPNGDNYWRVYRYLHCGLAVTQRLVLTKYRNLIGLEPMPGKLCTIKNTRYEHYIYRSGGEYDEKRRLVLRWCPGNADYDSTWRIVDAPDGYKYLYSVWWGEYMYCVHDTYHNDYDRRYVCCWSSHGVSETQEASWTISSDLSKCTIINRRYGEPLYCSSIAFTDDRKYVFTWTDKNIENDAYFNIEECPYDTTLDLNKPRE